MKNEIIAKEFYDMAIEYCNLVKTTKITEDLIEDLIVRIMKLYIAGISLPKVRPDNNVFKEEYPHIRVNVDSKFDRYYELFSPYEKDSFVGASINDDLEGIYDDLCKGIVQYEAGYIKNAIFEWRETHSFHWGNHATSVLRALHQVRADNWYKRD